MADSDSGRKGLAFIAASADLVPLWKFGSGGDTDSTEIRSASRRRGLSPRRWEGGSIDGGGCRLVSVDWEGGAYNGGSCRLV